MRNGDVKPSLYQRAYGKFVQVPRGLPGTPMGKHDAKDKENCRCGGCNARKSSGGD